MSKRKGFLAESSYGAISSNTRLPGYLRFRRAVLALYAVVAATFPAVYLMAGENAGPSLYSLLVVTFLLILFLAVDYARYAARARTLDAVLENISEAAHALPDAIGPMEARYHALARSLYAMLGEQAERLSLAHGEQLEYYTIWVHQIKTPIAAMRLALQSGAPRDVIEAELFKVERYVEMALQFVKLGDLSSDLIIREVSLAEVVPACVKKYAPLFIGRKLSVEIGDLHSTVPTDEKWLSFIIEQLLSNAVKYTQRGGVKLYLDGGALVVEDSGIGIRQEDIKRIFQKGYTGYNGRLDKRASGLGLHMAKRAADQLSIRMYVESKVGEGTRMKLVFPKRSDFLQ